MTMKEFKLRYRNSVLGFLWSLLNPIAMMIILWLVFYILLGSRAQNYPVFILPALLAWRFFVIGTSLSLWSIIGNATLVTRVYFPRWLLVLSSNLANLIGSLLEFGVLFPVLLVLGMRIEWAVVLLPIILALEFFVILGVSLVLASLNVRYRDLSQVWEITLQVGFYLSPILYDVSLIPSGYVLPYYLNPMAGVIVSIRKILYYGIFPTSGDLVPVVVICVVIMCLGYLVFHRLEPRFAEEV
jgi:lipopolysaccharide transport system permease protein